MAVFDLHVHTTRGSSDSSLTPLQLLRRARELGLDGVCLTEHGGGWERHEVERVFSSEDLTVVRGLEVDTDMGHVLVFGMHSYVTGMSTIRDLRKIVDRVGGVMVSAHPFRNLFHERHDSANLVFSNHTDSPKTAAEAASHALFSIVDEVEVANGGNTEEEDRFAIDVARSLSFKGTGGSDAHSLHGLGLYVTIFDGEIRSETELLDALKAKDFAPARRMETGELTSVF